MNAKPTADNSSISGSALRSFGQSSFRCGQANGNRIRNTPNQRIVVADLQAGVIDMMFELTPGLMPLIEQGVVSPLAVGSAERVGALPDVPGMAEFADIGLGGVDIGAWEALMAPAGTPADVLARLNAAVRKAGEDAAMRDKLRASGFSVETSESPDALAEKIRREIPYWRKLVEDSGAKLDT